MKLVEAYINAFGNLEKKKINFNDGLNSFYEKNGAGKTTLALFIKAMFYGLEKSSKKNLERERVLPYSKEVCSGYLIFKLNGKEYKIERSFDKKQSNDTLRVTFNGKETNEFGDVPGEKIFGYNAESFARTLFIDSKDLDIGSTDDLNGKLGRFVEGDDEKVNYENVIDDLETLKKKYSPDRKTSTLGLIEQKKNEIDELNNKKNNLDNIKGSLEGKYQTKTLLEEDVKRLSKEIEVASKANQIGEQWKHYDSLKETVEAKENDIKDIKSRYINGMPSKEEEQCLIQLTGEKEHLLNERANYKLVPQEENSLLTYKNKYEETRMSNDDISSLNEKIKSLTTQKAIKDETLSQEEKETILKFDGKKDDIDELKDLYSKYESKERDFNALPEKVIVSEETGYSYLTQKIVIYIIAGLFLVAGVILGAAVSLWCFFIIAGVIPCSALLFYFELKDRKAIMPVEKDNPAKEKIKGDLENIESSLFSLFMKFGVVINDPADITKSYYSLLSSYDNFDKYKVKEETFNKENEARHASINVLESEIREGFKKHNIQPLGDYSESLSNYKNELSKYDSLKEKKDKFISETGRIDKEIAVLDKQIDSLKVKYLIRDVPAFLKQLMLDQQSLQLRENDLVNAKNELSKYVNEKSLDIATRPSSFEETDIGLKQDELTSKLNQLNAIQREIDDDENNITSLEEDVSSLEDKKDELNNLKENLSIIKTTLSSIREAEESLKNRYIKPIKDTFTKYSSYLEDNGLDVSIDGSFDLRIIEKGMERDYVHLSNGELTLCSLCYRLAIIDNIFGKDDEPFLILDDLFVDLDEEHLSKAKSLLKDLSKDRQILYFTCHESRNINS